MKATLPKINTRSASKNLSRSQPEEGREIVDLAKTRDFLSRSGEVSPFTNQSESAIMRAEDIVGRLASNAFSLAREVAVQTYNAAWFAAEEDLIFKRELAKKLATTFGVDGYQNSLWNEISGLNG